MLYISNSNIWGLKFGNENQSIILKQFFSRKDGQRFIDKVHKRITGLKTAPTLLNTTTDRYPKQLKSYKSIRHREYEVNNGNMKIYLKKFKNSTFHDTTEHN